MIDVIDGFLTPSYLRELDLVSRNAKYVFYENTSYAPHNVKGGKVFDAGQFVAEVIGGGAVADIELFALLHPMIFQVYDRFNGFRFFGVNRAKFNLLVERPDMPEGFYNTPHEDMVGGHSALLYLHDSDGETVFFRNGVEFERVKPVANRLVFFDSSIVHASSNPRSGGNRRVLNIVFKTERNSND